MPVFDLQIHPRDHELIAATHGRSFWVVDIAALEQMTPRRSRRVRISSSRTRRISGAKRPQLNLPGNGFAQAVMTFANPPFGADIVYRLAAGAPSAVKLVISDASGDSLATINGAGGAGVHHVDWNFQETRPRRRGGRALAVAAS